MRYIKPEMDVIRFKKKEIITASLTIGNENTDVDHVDGDGDF